MFPQQNAKTNLIKLIEDELAFERNFIYSQVAKGKMDAVEGDDEVKIDSVGYLDRLLLYLVDKMVQGNYSCCAMLRKTIENSIYYNKAPPVEGIGPETEKQLSKHNERKQE